MKTLQTIKKEAFHQLMQAISAINEPDEAKAFLTDLCTPAELESMADRWQVVPLLQKGMPYRTIHDETGVSVTTITRVARSLTMGSGGYLLIAERLEPS